MSSVPSQNMTTSDPRPYHAIPGGEGEGGVCPLVRVPPFPSNQVWVRLVMYATPTPPPRKETVQTGPRTGPGQDIPYSPLLLLYRITLTGENITFPHTTVHGRLKKWRFDNFQVWRFGQLCFLIFDSGRTHHSLIDWSTRVQWQFTAMYKCFYPWTIHSSI